MSLFPEKAIPPLRLLSCLIAFSMFLLISSSLSLLQFHDNSFITKSVLQLIFVNNTSISPTPDPNGGDHTPKSPTLDTNAGYDTPKSPLESPVLISGEGSDKQDVTVHEAASQDSETRDEVEKDQLRQCDKTRALLKVYMYDLPPEFHFGLLGWNGSASQKWPDVSDVKGIPSYPGGLNLQHSTEYWLTLDLLASSTGNVARPCSAVSVGSSSEADVIFVPFFSSLSYNRHSKSHERQKASVDRMLQEKLVRFLLGRREWKRSGGKDHLIVAHHPNSMLVARKRLGKSMFVLSDFGRYPRKIANLDKDVIAPYKHMVKTIPPDNSPSFNERPTLVYFQGAIYRKDGGVIRQELYYLLKDEKDVHFAFGSAQGSGIKDAGQGMATSKFCLNIAGDTPSSNRLFDAIASHCVPVIISDDIELPFEDVLDYSKFCVFVRARDAVKKGHLLTLLRGIKEEVWTKMWGRLKEVSGYYEYQFPSQPNDAVDMIWQTVARKKMSTQLNVHRKNRYNRIS